MPVRFGLVRYLGGAAFARTADAMGGPALLLLGLAVAGSARTASLVYASLTVAAAVGGPVLGVLFDRSPRPGRLLAWAMVGFGSGLVVVAVALGRVPVAVVMSVAVLAGVLSPALTGGWTAQLPDVVAAGPALRRAQSLDAATYNVGGLVGPGVAAAVAGLAGAGWAVGGAVVLLALAVAAAVGLPRPGRVPARTSVPAALRAGAAAIVTVAGLRRVTLASVVAFVGFGMFIVACPLIGAVRFDSAARGAALLSVLAVGALSATVVTARWPLPVPPDAVFVLATAVAGVVLVVAAVAPAGPVGGVLVVAAALLFGVADGPQLAAVIAVRHREAPPQVRAQVFTTGASLKVTAGAAGAALAGVLADRSLTLVLLVAAATQLAALGCFASVRVPAPGAADRSAAEAIGTGAVAGPGG